MAGCIGDDHRELLLRRPWQVGRSQQGAWQTETFALRHPFLGTSGSGILLTKEA